MLNQFYLVALTFTLCVEAPVVWLGYRTFAQSAWRLMAVFFAANLFTHGLLWSVWDLLPEGYLLRLGAAEAAVWLIEAELYARFFRGDTLRALMLAALANGASALLGLAGWWLLAPEQGFGTFLSSLFS